MLKPEKVEPADTTQAPTQAPTQNEDSKIQELLESLNFKDEKDIEVLKANPKLLETLAINIKSRREANSEAKKYREKIEKIEEEKKKSDEKALLEKGEFKKLYEDATKKLTEKEQYFKDKEIESELRIHAIKNGIKKDEYLKLFDKSKLTFDENGKINNIEESFNQFFKDNTDLFESKSAVKPESTKPAGSVPTNIELLREKAMQTRNRDDMAVYLAAVRNQNKT